ncbi:hypothetical protein EYF80_009942 [Liparis tanakae]|uniref:Uncharacterized protein n=1 Tax=Liparis tanakae TaxID=230148 RepID=A0A4Z2IPT0_9TELE|nr:hypothetical protein EYF80_009942 [Liparis tanakae]
MLPDVKRFITHINNNNHNNLRRVNLSQKGAGVLSLSLNHLKLFVDVPSVDNEDEGVAASFRTDICCTD